MISLETSQATRLAGQAAYPTAAKYCTFGLQYTNCIKIIATEACHFWIILFKILHLRKAPLAYTNMQVTIFFFWNRANLFLGKKIVHYVEGPYQI